MKIRRVSVVASVLVSAMCVGCGDSAADKQTIVQVGNARLMPTDVKAVMPLALSGDDSLAFMRDYVQGWINQQVLFEQGLRNVSNLEDLEEQVQEYRRELIAETYVNEMIEARQWQATEDECRLFYDKYGADLKLDHPIVQGVLIKLQSSSSKIKTVKGWLDQILTGKQKSIDELEEFCAQKAVFYDNFLEEWSPLTRLADQLPVSIVDAASFLRCKTFEQKNLDAVYLFVIKDYRLAGERQPYEVAKIQIQELIAQRKRQQYRMQLIAELIERGKKSGFIRENPDFFSPSRDSVAVFVSAPVEREPQIEPKGKMSSESVTKPQVESLPKPVENQSQSRSQVESTHQTSSEQQSQSEVETAPASQQDKQTTEQVKKDSIHQ